MGEVFPILSSILITLSLLYQPERLNWAWDPYSLLFFRRYSPLRPYPITLPYSQCHSPCSLSVTRYGHPAFYHKKSGGVERSPSPSAAASGAKSLEKCASVMKSKRATFIKKFSSFVAGCDSGRADDYHTET